MDSLLIRQTRFALLAPAEARAARAPARVAAARPAWQRVPCPVPPQEQSNWCWCAVTLAVHRHYQPSDTTTTQCQVADRVLQRDDACSAPSDPQVNVTYYLERALAALPQHPALHDSVTPDHDPHCRSFLPGNSPGPQPICLVDPRYRPA